MYKKIKTFIYETIEDNVSDRLSHKVFEAFIITLIILNILMIVAESSFIHDSTFLGVFETISVLIFTLEFILRLWTADLKFKDKNFIVSRLNVVFSPMGIIDILAILPFYLSLLFPMVLLDGRVLRAVRLMRLLRIFKLTRFLDSFRLIKTVIFKRRNELLITGFIAFIVLVVAATLMFEIEHSAQPDKFPDILSSFWWAIATLTTIGYGDVFPITPVGKFISAIISILGIGLIALPTGILSTSLLEEFRTKSDEQNEQKKDNSKCYCPHCGKKLNGE